jgi:TolB protein
VAAAVSRTHGRWCGLGRAAARPAEATFPGGNGQIAFESDRDGDFEIYVMNADGTGQTNVTLHPTSDDVDPAWAPDGSSIAFSSLRDGNQEVYIMGADGSAQTRLTDDPAADGNPAWSPDGKKIAFESFRDGNSEIYVMNADGSGATNLTQNGAADFDAAWSPDGSKIAFASTRDGNREIYADGSGQTNLTQNAVFDFEPEWSPDGSKIAFRRGFFSDPDPDLYVMNADGSLPTLLTDNLDFDVDPAWQTIPSADLALSMGASPNVANSKKPLTYAITVANIGPSNAAEVVVTDVLTPEMRFVSATPSQGSCVTPPPGSTGTVRCDLGFLPNTRSATAQVVVKVVVKKTTVSNTASVASNTPDPNAANNSVTIATPVR